MDSSDGILSKLMDIKASLSPGIMPTVTGKFFAIFQKNSHFNIILMTFHKHLEPFERTNRSAPLNFTYRNGPKDVRLKACIFGLNFSRSLAERSGGFSPLRPPVGCATASIPFQVIQKLYKSFLDNNFRVTLLSLKLCSMLCRNPTVRVLCHFRRRLFRYRTLSSFVCNCTVH